MGRNILVVVDMQNDFVTGSLGTKEAVSIVPAVIDKVKTYNSNKDEIIFTKDTHHEDYHSTQEGSQEGECHIDEHCIEGTYGWQLIDELEDIKNKNSYKVFEKPGFGSEELAAKLKAENAKEPISEIHVVGLCTDICVVCNTLLLKTVLPEVPIYVHADCCAGKTPQKHKAALDTMESCQINIV